MLLAAVKEGKKSDMDLAIRTLPCVALAELAALTPDIGRLAASADGTSALYACFAAEAARLPIVSDLLKPLASADPALAGAAARTLAILDPPEAAILPLAAGLNTDDETYLLQLLKALRAAREKAVPALPTLFSRLYVRDVVERTKPLSIELLLQVTRNERNSDLGLAAIELLGDIGPEAEAVGPVLDEILTDRRARGRDVVQAALKKIRPE
jgi:hypothetical protein